MGWTEDPANELAQPPAGAPPGSPAGAQRGARGACGRPGGADKAETLEAVLGFFGDLGVDGRPSRIEAALDYVLGRGKPPRYRTPGETVRPARLASARVYVLGPPQDEALLLRSDPSQQASEVYEKRLGAHRGDRLLRRRRSPRRSPP